MDAARGTVQLVGTQLTTATPISKIARATVRASGSTVVLVETTLAGMLVPTPTTDSAETTVRIVDGVGHLAVLQVTPVQTACAKEVVVQEEMPVLLVTGTATSHFANLEDFPTLTTTNLSV